MESKIDALDWESIAAALPPPTADAYHTRARAGATKFKLEWGAFEAPPGNETWWDQFDAYCSYWAHPWNQYAFETLVASYDRLVQTIARKLLLRTTGTLIYELLPNPQDTGGSDLYAVGMAAVVEAIRARPRIAEDDEGLTTIGPDDPDIMVQLSRYIAKSVRNAMILHLKTEAPWRHALREENGELRNERKQPLLSESEPPQLIGPLMALEEACTEPFDKFLCTMKWEGRLTEAEIGEFFDMSRDQVNRALTRIKVAMEKCLKLDHRPGRKRKDRRHDIALYDHSETA